MNIINNALNAKNVKVHGMSSAKWTTKDKITQYKGLVNLYKRDRQITDVDVAVASKKQAKSLQTLRKSIESGRETLNNAICGDRQKLRNTLAEHRELQLAYQNTDPKKVMENVNQIVFNKRKLLDKLQYQLKTKSQQLIDLKLEEALLQDRLTYASLDKLKDEEEAQIVTGKVRDALLKKEAALAIQQTYTQIINVMQKDALYFDGVLLAIQNDYYYQCKCILNVATQGQLAVEYKNDKEQEFATLEKTVVEQMKTQKRDLQMAREQADNLESNLKLLLRRDSDLTTCVLKVEETQDLKTLRNDLTKIEKTLNFLKTTTLVSSFEKIYPSLVEQKRQKKRLTRLLKKCEKNRDILLNKMNHAELMGNVLKNTMVETTGEYSKRKKELLEKIEAERAKKEKSIKDQFHRRRLIAEVRISLAQIRQLCKTVAMPGEKRTTVLNIEEDKEPEPEPPEEEEIEGLKIIEELTPILTYLMTNISEKLDQAKMDTAFKFYEVLVGQRSNIETIAEVTDENPLIEEFTTEVSHVLTREDIKQQSAAIVAASTQQDDLVAVVPIKSKRKKF